MLTKTVIALATVLALGASSGVLAQQDEGEKGGYRVLGPGGAATQGINPAHHPLEAAACAKRLKTYDPNTMTYVGRDGRRHPCGTGPG